MIFSDQRAFLEFGVRGIGDAAEKIFEPLPVGLVADEVLARQAGGVNANPAVTLLDEFLQRLLLVGRHIEGSFLQLDEDLVVGQILVADEAAVAGDVDREIVVGGHLLKNRRGGGDHFQMIFGFRGFDEHFERRRLGSG